MTEPEWDAFKTAAGITEETALVISSPDADTGHFCTLCTQFKDPFSTICFDDLRSIKPCQECLQTFRNNSGAGIILDYGAAYYLTRDHRLFKVAYEDFRGLDVSKFEQSGRKHHARQG
jgi:hypothetical protein